MRYSIRIFCCNFYISGVCILTSSSTSALGIDANSVELPYRAFSPVYLGLGVSRTNPAGLSENEYNEGASSPSIYYRFFMHDQWHMGVTGGFKTLYRGNDTQSSFFAVSQDSYRLFRIYHPAWLGIGLKTMYLIGIRKAGLPYERDPNQAAQVGVGLGLSAFYLASNNILLHAEISRWRGTMNNRLHAIEFGLGASLALQIR